MQKINYTGKSPDSIYQQKPSMVGNGTGLNQMTSSHPPQDFYSIMSALQSALIQRQMEVQNWIAKKLRINNPTLKMLICLMVMYPSQSYFKVTNVFFRLLSICKMFWMRTKSLLKRKPQPNKIEIKIPYIHENNINYFYTAVDWFIKNNRQIKTDSSTVILTLKDEIKEKEFSQKFLENYPTKSSNTVVFKKEEYTFNKKKEPIIIYTSNGEIRKENWIVTIWSYYSSKNKLNEFCSYIGQQYALYKSKKVWQQLMFTNQKSMWNQKSITKNKRKIETVVLLDNQNIKIKEDLVHFSNTEEWHLEHGIPYKKSYLFYGPPGTGKTSMIKAISYEFQRHIHYLSLHEITSDSELNELMGKIDYGSTIVVIEDIDAMSDVTNKRKSLEEERKLEALLQKQNQQNKQNQNQNQQQEKEETSPIIINMNSEEDVYDNHNKHHQSNNKKKSGITLSGLLNAIDGIHDNHGMILVMTSNMPEKLDPALIREGRVDDKILFGYCSKQQIYKMMKNLLILNNFMKINVYL